MARAQLSCLIQDHHCPAWCFPFLIVRPRATVIYPGLSQCLSQLLSPCPGQWQLLAVSGDLSVTAQQRQMKTGVGGSFLAPSRTPFPGGEGTGAQLVALSVQAPWCLADRGTVQKVIVLPRDDMETEELMLEEIEVFKVRAGLSYSCC